MQLPRVYVDAPLVPGESLPLPEGARRHLIQSLRLQAGARLVLFNGDGRDYQAHLAGVGRALTLAVESPGTVEPPPPIDIRLAIGVSKGERMDYVIQKAVELGVSRISPLFTERSVVQLAGERFERRMVHWQGVLIGACEQSGRRRLPLLDPATRFEDWVIGCPADGLMLDPRAGQALVDLPPPKTQVTLLVGPEGGLSPRERQQALGHRLRAVRLGPRVLRTETAPLAAIAAIQTLWGDFGL
ncbi:MAG: 16S rRNA (uracil(1498)-N(3))-methyltransferase [Chromatiaceae bacterium]